jgi:hypothetical protein
VSLSARGNPSPEFLGDIFGISDERPVVVDDADINVDVNADLVREVRCASLMIGRGCFAHINLGVMAVARQAARAAIPGGCVGGRCGRQMRSFPAPAA